MNLFKSKLMNRIALGKAIGFVFGLAGFFIMPLVFTDATLMLAFALLFWYITLGSIVGVFGVWTKYPLFKVSVPFWFRGAFIGAWMNFVLALFMFDNLTVLMVGTCMAGWSPFRIVLEGAIFGLIVDFVATKNIGEGKKLIK